MSYSLSDQMIALAGVHQALRAVRQIATRGTVDSAVMEPCLYSLFQIDAEDVAAVYGEPGVLRPGVNEFVSQLTGKPERDLELTRYLIAVIKRERSLVSDLNLVSAVREGILDAETRLEELPLLHPSLIMDLATLYKRTIGTLPPPLVIRGDPDQLKNPENANRIHALLLAAIRSALLWRQTGGTRWKLLLNRQRLLDEARAYLKASRPTMH